ncbi:hypothetical protein [Alicyclobacillus sp. SP_1]|uniref:hypothetical protein n=1 Tax=Alicyclobacillus sp. SP_1 TaxID=2942475 RepID=UPI002158118B|nr:hypothetical protein [Alicyclobacillus sp. SP_1]
MARTDDIMRPLPVVREAGVPNIRRWYIPIPRMLHRPTLIFVTDVSRSKRLR